MNQLHHERIDKGIERPRYEHKPILPQPETGHPSIPVGLDPKEVLDRYLTEATTSQIATEYGISRKCLVRWLRDVVPDAWNQVQIIRALCRKDDADEGLAIASDALSLARAREMLKSGQWDLERLDAKNYGQKQEVTHELGESFTAALLAISRRRAVEKTVESLPDSVVMSNSTPKLINGLADPSTDAPDLSTTIPLRTEKDF